MDNRYIGVFNAGVGGLTILPHLARLLPNERVLFFSDIARSPYGSKSPETIRSYALEIGRFMERNHVKMMVAADSTVSAVAIEALRNAFPDIPVVGMIGPTSQMIVNSCGPEEHLGVIATKATVASGCYPMRIQQEDPKHHRAIYQKACPVLVSMIEEGFINHPIMKATVHYYLDDFVEDNQIDTMVLGCSHFPLIAPLLREEFPEVSIVDALGEAALTVKRQLTKQGRLAEKGNPKQNIYYTSYPSSNHYRMLEQILDTSNMKLDIRTTNLSGQGRDDEVKIYYANKKGRNIG